MSDYDLTILPKEIAEVCEKGGHKLTEQQFQLMSGALAMAQAFILNDGIEAYLERLGAMSK